MLSQYQPLGTIFKTQSPNFSHSDEFHTLTVENNKLELAKAKLKNEFRLAIINSNRSFTELTVSGYRNKKIGENFCKVSTPAY